MKKIRTKKQEEQKQKRNRWIMGIVLTFVLAFSIFGMAANSFGNHSEDSTSGETINYKGYEFTLSNNYYVLNLGQQSFSFLENPLTLPILDNLNISRLLPSYLGETIYIHAGESYSALEIQNNLGEYASRIQPACLNNSLCLNSELPLKTCDEPFILIIESNESKIYEKDKCVFIEGKRQDLPKLTDRFLLTILGIEQ